eukprot:6188095-Pleurochrysis_carterae.AAC.4
MHAWQTPRSVTGKYIAEPARRLQSEHRSDRSLPSLSRTEPLLSASRSSASAKSRSSAASAEARMCNSARAAARFGRRRTATAAVVADDAEVPVSASTTGNGIACCIPQWKSSLSKCGAQM